MRKGLSIRKFCRKLANSSQHFDPVAQLEEHLTSSHGASYRKLYEWRLLYAGTP